MSPSHLRLLRALATMTGGIVNEIAEHAHGSHVCLHLRRDETLARVVERIQCGPIPDELAEALAVELEIDANQAYLEAEDVPQPSNRSNRDDEAWETVQRAERALIDLRNDLRGAIPTAIADARELLDVLQGRTLAVAELANLCVEPVGAVAIADAVGLERGLYGRTAGEIVAHAKAQRHAGDSLRLRLRLELGLTDEADDDALVLGVAGLAEVEGQRDELSAALLESEAQRRALAARLAGLDLDDA